MNSYPIHPDDLATREQLVEKLLTKRKLSKLSQAELSRLAGRGEGFIHSMEKGLRDSPVLSSLQDWAGVFGCRVEFGLENFWMHHQSDPDMNMMYMMSRPWDNNKMARRWLVAAMEQWQHKQHFDIERLATLLGVTVGAVRDWYKDANDPLLNRTMMHARVMGTRLTMTLWEKEDWTFGL